ncbi:Gamma-butyrobetaine dioxygenase [Trichoplax sp. H2]|nr:Gamma-butyrobetaine dioxygenase [Trichoplax sp. H2]|eukprot:RDD36324.1 Gamma-butyrobetaine dioxygenase [Trichoplax sp. H2]
MHRLGIRLIRPLEQLFQSKQTLTRSRTIVPLAFRKKLVVFNSVAIENDISNRQLHVKWDDGTSSRFPHIYLRDHCQCPNCFHPSPKQRNIGDTNVFPAYDAETRASWAELRRDRQEIEMIWEIDNHVSVFDTNWLKTRRFPTSDDQVGNKVVAEYIATVALVLVKNVSPELGQVERLANRIAYLRIQFLHCIQQASAGGGESEFANGFHVAKVLKKENPYFFELLTQYEFIYFDIVNDYIEYNLLSHHPLIILNGRGEVIRFVHNNHTRSSILDVPEDKVNRCLPSIPCHCENNV